MSAYPCVKCLDCEWFGHESQLRAQACPLCDGRCRDIEPAPPDERARLSGAILVADFILAAETARTWGELAAVMAALDITIRALQSVQTTAGAREKGLAFP